MKNLLFPASIVGSLPRPKFVLDEILNNKDPFSEKVNQAVSGVIAAQERVGLDVISDGEWRRKSYLEPIAKVTTGLVEYLRDGLIWHRVVDKLKHDHPGFFAQEGAFVKKYTDKMVKVCLPSPYLLGQRMWAEDNPPKFYKSRQEFMEDLAPILRQEILLLKAVGVEIVQIDDPHICLFVDSKIRAGYKNPEAELKNACNLVNEVVKDIKGVELCLHLCRRNKGRRGWIGEGGYESIIPEISKIQVNQFVMEYSIPVAGDFRALKQLPDHYRVGLGCVDCRFEHIDTVAEIVNRAEEALKYVAPNRIWLNPDCGFAPSSLSAIPFNESFLKLRNEALAAQALREKYQ